jgi:glucose-1-phosphate cytidylyltransferase
MKVVILAGGLGTRLSEETDIKPKPMVEIGGKPILWHIMKNYSKYGFNEFIILLGYKGYSIKEYFANYLLHQSDITIDLKNNSMEIHDNHSESWKVTLVDTGMNSMTGGRVKRVEKYLDNKPFLLTYGDGVSDINIDELISFHKSHGKAMTVTSSLPAGRFGGLSIEENNKVSKFLEKPKGDGNWVSAGYFVCESKVLNYINDDSTILEEVSLKHLAEDGELYTYKHKGFWKPMDTLKDKLDLNEMWNKGNAPWKV